MWPFAHGLDELTEVDLQSLIALGVREGTTIEFKREMYQRRNPQHVQEALRDVAAMANAEGGVLIIGIEEDGQGGARGLVPVPDAETEGNRLIHLCLSYISERIPGLRAARIPVQGGNVIVVRIPRSYRRPHMITYDGATDFWVRHDRQKSRMSIAEVRMAVTTTEDAEMKVEHFSRARITNAHERNVAFMLAATPLLLEDGRLAIDDQRLLMLLRRPPAYRPRVGVGLAGDTSDVQPTLRGLAADTQGVRGLEVFRNGHIEFLLLRHDQVSEKRQGQSHLWAWAVAEYIRNFQHFVTAVRDIGEITDPYVTVAAVFNCRGVMMARRALDEWGRGETNAWSESDHIVLDPITIPADEASDRAARRIADRFWNAFHFDRCPFFLPDGTFEIPQGR
jgi:Putative DNA-binding domain